MASSASPALKEKFSVYRNPSFSAALKAKSLRPSPTTLRLSFLASFSSASLFLAVLIKSPFPSSNLATKAFQILAGLAFLTTTLSTVEKVIYRRKRLPVPLTRRQMELLGLNKHEQEEEAIATPIKPPPKNRPLFPIRKSSNVQHTSPPWSSPGEKMAPSPPASFLGSQARRRSRGKELMTEEMLERFLAEVDEKIVESSSPAATPPTMATRGLGMGSPEGSRSTPLRPVRRSPGNKYATPPKKGDGELPPSMTTEEMIARCKRLGIFPDIERWRDRLRQWFSSVLLGPLVEKIDTSHLQVMQSAGSLGISIVVSQVGVDSLINSAPVNVSPIDLTEEWQPTLDEDAILHQLRAFLVQARDAVVAQVPQASLQQHQQNTLVPLMQSCINSIIEHQWLTALMKGELVKGLLPQRSVHVDYTVRRVRELAQGTCVRNYEYRSDGAVYDNVSKKWTSEFPSDSHLLGYLFCCFLNRPKWRLHVEPTFYSSAQAGESPLFLGCLPPKETFLEKYVAIVSSVPSIIHPGACILVIGKQSPIFALYWDMKLQFSLQGRTALWDALVLLCHRVEVGFGGMVQGLHLGSSIFEFGEDV